MKSNIIIPAAVTRMAEGLDTSQYPPMDPSLVSPVVGWLAKAKAAQASLAPGGSPATVEPLELALTCALRNVIQHLGDIRA